MSELHIFDFDGTLFYSPAPTHDAVTALLRAKASASHGSSGDAALTPTATTEDPNAGAETPSLEESNKLYGSLLNPVDSGGYGWFQSIHTMTPPAVPETPDPTQWFVAPLLAHMRALVKRREAQMRDPRTKKDKVPLLYVLTGRDVKYYDRIWTLLQQVGLDKEVEDVILKPHETSGTVTYKLNSFFKLIQYHRPSRVFYYEDRVEQGGRLLEGMRVLEEVLYANQDSTRAATERVGVVTFDVNATPPAVGSALHVPQPAVHYKFAASETSDVAPGAETDPRLATLTSILRASPDALLRDACYPLDRLSVFYEDPADATGAKAVKAAEHAERQAQKWVEGTVEFWNAKNDYQHGRGGRGGRGGGRGRGTGAPARKAKTEFNAQALHDAIRFSVAPPFTFMMVLVPEALCERSNHMLEATQFAELVERLKVEKTDKEEKARQHPVV